MSHEARIEALERRLTYQQIFLSSVTQAAVNAGLITCSDIADAAAHFAAIHIGQENWDLALIAKQVETDIRPQPSERPALRLVPTE